MTEMQLYDLRVTVERIEGRSVCGLAVGDYFEVTESSRIRIPVGRHFCMYALQSVLPPQAQVLIPNIVEGIHGAFSLATAQTFWLGVVGAVVAAVAALAIKEIPLRATNDAPVPTAAIDDAQAAKAPAAKPAPSAD